MKTEKTLKTFANLVISFSNIEYDLINEHFDELCYDLSKMFREKYFIRRYTNSFVSFSEYSLIIEMVETCKRLYTTKKSDIDFGYEYEIFHAKMERIYNATPEYLEQVAENCNYTSKDKTTMLLLDVIKVFRTGAKVAVGDNSGVDDRYNEAFDRLDYWNDKYNGFLIYGNTIGYVKFFCHHAISSSSANAVRISCSELSKLDLNERLTCHLLEYGWERLMYRKDN